MDVSMWQFPESKKHPKTDMNTKPILIVMWRRPEKKRWNASMFREVNSLEAQAFARRKSAEGFLVECETRYFGGFA